MAVNISRANNASYSNNGNDEVFFDIVSYIGVLAEYQTGWKKEVNIVAWNGNPPKFDVRDWSPDHERMSRGITLHEEEARKLADHLARRFRSGKARMVHQPAGANGQAQGNGYGANQMGANGQVQGNGYGANQMGANGQAQGNGYGANQMGANGQAATSIVPATENVEEDAETLQEAAVQAQAHTEDVSMTETDDEEFKNEENDEELVMEAADEDFDEEPDEECEEMTA